jgi:hydroxyacylglutathione hydrolase
MKVEILASTISDNFFYLLHEGGDGILIDPIDAGLALRAVESLGLTDVRILVTHGHPDHVDGNEEVADALDALVLAPAQAVAWPVAHDVGLQEGDVVPLGDTLLKVWQVPGHTDDHLMFFTDEHLFVGDLLFFGGVGHCRAGGDVADLCRSVARLSGLPGGARVYPGHDYSGTNNKFGRSVLPSHEGLMQLEGRLLAQAQPRVLWCSTLDDERATNPFLRTQDELLQQSVRDLAPEWRSELPVSDATFFALRAMRDRFVVPS